MNAKWSLVAENESEKKNHKQKSCMSAIYIWCIVTETQLLLFCGPDNQCHQPSKINV